MTSGALDFRSRDDVVALQEALRVQRYVADRSLATVLVLGRALSKPVLLEGEPGVGKTEVASCLARVLGTSLIRLQCYEGLDAAHALYEWNYPRQLLHIRAAEGTQADAAAVERSIFTEEYLIKRPLLAAISSDSPVPPVLLIDEVDRADEPFEAFLLELLSDFQVTIPELGTLRATRRPLVILTSNRTREIHGALRRRCLYTWLGYPSLEREVEVVRTRLPEISEELAGQICRFVARLRQLDLVKPPGPAETVEWGAALLWLGAARLDPDSVSETLGMLCKSREDLHRLDHREVTAILQQLAQERMAALRP